MTTRLLSVAEAEFADAAAYYEAQRSGLGDIFIEHVIRSTAYLVRHPLIGILIGRRVRKLVLKKFPYNLIYYASESEIVVVAVAHHKRKPNYWRDRLADGAGGI